MGTLVVRDYSSEDAESLISIINDEWHFDLYGDNWSELVTEYIEEYLLRSEKAEVAVLNGEVVGIVTSCAEMDDGVFERIEKSMGLYPGGYILDRRTMDDLDEKLRSENDITGLGELVLLIVDSSVRGKQIGRVLMDSATKYLKSRGCIGMHISTDTDCNYGFYEHLGAKRIGSGECIVQNKPIVRYLYRLDF